MNKNEVEDPNSLLVPKEAMVLQLLDNAWKLKALYGEAFINPPVGLYLPGKAEPFISDSSVLFLKSDPKPFTILTKDINTIEEDIYNRSGICVLPLKSAPRCKENILSRPTLPVMEITLLRYFFEHIVHSRCRWAVRTGTENKILQCFKPEYRYLYTEFHIEDTIDKSREILINFIGDDVWNYYFFKMYNANLIIEKSVDHRIYEWTKLQYDLANPNSND